MKKYLLLIFLLSLIIKKITNECNSLNNRRYCRSIEPICFTEKIICGIRNCKECANCDDGFKCLFCKPDYHKAEDEKSCKKDETDDQPPKDDEECNLNCHECSFPSTYINMNCISCKNNFYKVNGTDNCFDLSLLNESFYIKDNIFYPCDENCLTCSDEKNETSNNCLSCDNEEEGLYLLEDKNNCEKSNFPGYYLNEKILKKCYKSCKTCKGPIEIDHVTKFENHNCQECADNFYKLPNGEFKYNCYDREKIIEIYTRLISIKEFQSKINDNIKIFQNSSSLINGSDFIATILSSNNLELKYQLDMGISAIDLGNCTQIIKEYNNISESENLIIVNMESKKNKNLKKIENNNNDNFVDIGKNNQIEISYFYYILIFQPLI